MIILIILGLLFLVGLFFLVRFAIRCWRDAWREARHPEEFMKDDSVGARNITYGN